MHRFRKENWARKVDDSYPKNWSTTYRDLALSTDRHYVHDLGHDPHYVYDHDTSSRYAAGLRLNTSVKPAVSHRPRQKTPVSSRSDGYQPDCDNYNPFDNRFHACHSKSLCGCRRRGLPPGNKRRIQLPPLHLANQSTQLASELQNDIRRRPVTAHRSRQPGVNEKFLGFKYHGAWKPNRTSLGYSISH